MSRWQTLCAIDFDKWACLTYAANFPGVDVRCASVADEIDRLPDADVILGGPPCQPHSFAGKRKASADKRDCGPDFAAATARKRPRAFLMENVAGLMSSEDGKYAQRLLASLEVSGYVVQIRTLDAVNFGVPQFRNRCWWWGIRRDLFVDGVRHCWPVATHAWPPPDGCMFGGELLAGVTVGEALGLSLSAERGRIDGASGWSGQRIISGAEPSPAITGEGTNPEFIRVMGGGRNWPKDASGFYRRDKRDITDEPSTTITDYNGATTPYLAIPRTLNKPCPTISAGSHRGGPEPISHRVREGFLRRLQPLECARLQSVPDDFIWPSAIKKSAMYKVVGNGWASRMGAEFSIAFGKADPDSETVIDLFCGGGLGAVGWHGRYWSLSSSPSVATAAEADTENLSTEGI